MVGAYTEDLTNQRTVKIGGWALGRGWALARDSTVYADLPNLRATEQPPAQFPQHNSPIHSG